MPVVAPAETVRRLSSARERGDLGAMLALLHPDIVATAAVDGAVMHGIGDVRAYFAGERGDGRRTEVDAHHIVADGDVVTVRGRVRPFRGGCLADSPACWRFVVRAGRVLRIDPLPIAALRIAA